MVKILIIIALLLIVYLLYLLRGYRANFYAWRLGFPRPRYRVLIEKDVKVSMLDGIALYADIYRPEKRGKYPVMIARTPYNKKGGINSYKEFSELFASQGYVVVIQDVRGKHASEGRFLPYFNEALDGHATITWAGTAPWSNGKVALVGTSYLGSCAWLATQYANPHLRTIVPLFTTYNTYTIWMDGGMPYLKGPLTWLSEFSERSDNLEFDYRPIEQVLWKLPVSELDAHAVGHLIPFYREYLTHRVPDQFWETIGVKPMQMDLPVLIVGGWYDPFIKNTIEDYQRMVSFGPKSQQSELVIGPWAHNPAQEYKGAKFGKGAGLGDLLTECLKWCDRWMKHTDPTRQQHQVRYFMMGKNEWRTSPQWPPDNTETEPFYLCGEGQEKDPKRGGLSLNLPVQQHGSRYIYDPRDPALFRGTHLLYTDGWIMDMIQEDDMERNDILTFTSEPLKKELSVAGTIKLVLHVSSSATDTDFCAKVCDVHPNGKIYNITPGFLRMRFRESLHEPKLMEPGKIYRIEILFRPVANTFLKRHRIQLQVTSADFPIHNRNLNTGMSCEFTTEIKEADQTVYTGGIYDSQLLLPVVK
ncbi:MAG: CocE/NonD family hydrolase [Parachlamydia sp.]|nr:CocE/NonD family hydrolase [Parachlamydia sp.]